MKHVKGEKFGKEYNGIVYSAKNDKGEIVSNPFKSSLFGKMFGFEGLTKIMKNNTEILKTKDMTARSKAVVSVAMRTAKTGEQFTKALQDKAMDAVFRINGDGRIYGVTFIDHENRVVLNGSRLGKEFSANVFNNHFNETVNCPQSPNRPEQPVSPISSASDTSIIEEAFGIFNIQPLGENYEEIAFARKKRKKKRKTHIS
jgi:hypothetical protein